MTIRRSPIAQWWIPGDTADRQQTEAELEFNPAHVEATVALIDRKIGDPAARSLILGALGLQDITKRQMRRLDKTVSS